MAAEKKHYGLFVPKKTTVLRPSLSIFDEDDDKVGRTSVGAELQKEGLKARMKKQTQLQMQRALDEDPTVYEYDSIYDEMDKKKRQARQTKVDTTKKPKYIESLLKTAEVRKREYERRVERKVHKEREAEGDEFADKEAFVTTAYRKKMEELQKLEEEERREAALEAIGDVTKQRDLTGFYRHMMRARFGEENLDGTPIKKEVEETESKPSSKEAKNNEDVGVADGSGVKKERRGSSSDDGNRNKRGRSDSPEGEARGQRRKRRSSRSRSRSRSSSPKRHENRSPEQTQGKSPAHVKTEDVDDAASQDPLAAQKAEDEKPPSETDVKTLFERRNVDTAVSSARERYLQRQRTQTNVAAVITDKTA